MFLAGAHPPAAMSAAVGGGNALSELTQGGQASTATQTTATTTTTESNSNSSKVVVLALVAAVALLIGIAFVIVRQGHSCRMSSAFAARSAAPSMTSS